MRGGLGMQPIWGHLGRVKPQKTKAKKERGVGKATNLGGGGWLSWVKLQNQEAKKARAVGKAPNLGDLEGKTPKKESKERAGGWEATNLEGSWAVKIPKP